MDKHGFREIQKKLNLTNDGVSEALDVELFTVQNWASGNWPIPDPIVKFLRTLLSTQRGGEAIYMEGYNRGCRIGRKDEYLNKVEGYTTGYDDGYREGCGAEYVKGFEKGRAEGHSTGYNAGYRSGIISACEAIK